MCVQYSCEKTYHETGNIAKRDQRPSIPVVIFVYWQRQLFHSQRQVVNVRKTVARQYTHGKGTTHNTRAHCFFQRREGRHLNNGGRGVCRGDNGRRKGLLRDDCGRGVRRGSDGRYDDGRCEERRCDGASAPRRRRAPRGTAL